MKRRRGLSLAERLWMRRRVTASGCWEWTLSTKGAGYGQILYQGRQLAVHRLAYEVFVEPVPAGLEVCHRCDNPLCFRLTHLFVATHGENVRDMYAKGRGRNQYSRVAS